MFEIVVIHNIRKDIRNYGRFDTRFEAMSLGEAIFGPSWYYRLAEFDYHSVPVRVRHRPLKKTRRAKRVLRLDHLSRTCVYTSRIVTQSVYVLQQFEPRLDSAWTIPHLVNP